MGSDVRPDKPEGSLEDRPSARPRSRLPRSEITSRYNDRLGRVLVLVVAVAAVPFGSNRPFFWCLWAAVLGLVGAWYFRAIAKGQIEPRVRFRAIWFVASLFGIVAMAITMQVLPIGDLVPIRFLNQFGDTVLSPTLSLAPGDTALALLRWLTYGIVFYLMLQLGLRERRVQFVLTAIVLIVAVDAVYALAALTQLGDTILFFEKVSYLGFATGTFVNRNSFATFLSLGMVAATALVAGDGLRAIPRHPVLILALIAMLVALLATQSRMGLVAGFAGVGTTLFLRRSRAGGNLVPFLVLLIAAAIILGAYGAGVGERLLHAEREADTRIELYKQVLAMIGDRPLLGHGAGAFEQSFQLWHQPGVAIDLIWRYAHSTYLALWSGLGLIVGTIPLAIVAVVFFKIWRAPSPSESGRRSAENTAALGATVTVALHSTVDFSLEIQAVALLYTSMLALGATRAFHSVSGGAKP